MADALVADETDYINDEFLTFVGEHMNRWLECLDAIEAADSLAEPTLADD
jgi:hypothetical protein